MNSDIDVIYSLYAASFDQPNTNSVELVWQGIVSDVTGDHRAREGRSPRA